MDQDIQPDVEFIYEGPVNKNRNNFYVYCGNGQQQQKATKGDCDKYCWEYNKNWCHRQNCEWEHRCKYCNAWGHGFWNCFKRLAKKKEGGEGAEIQGSK